MAYNMYRYKRCYDCEYIVDVNDSEVQLMSLPGKVWCPSCQEQKKSRNMPKVTEQKMCNDKAMKLKIERMIPSCQKFKSYEIVDKEFIRVFTINRTSGLSRTYKFKNNLN